MFLLSAKLFLINVGLIVTICRRTSCIRSEFVGLNLTKANHILRPHKIKQNTKQKAKGDADFH